MLIFLYLIAASSAFKGQQHTAEPLTNDAEGDINLSNITTIASLEYLGAGYDLLSNKTKEDRDPDEIDVNYKNPVIKFSWSPEMRNLNNTLEYLHPKGTFIYNFPSCSISQENKLDKSADKIESAINSEVSVDVVNFRGSAKTKNLKATGQSSNNLEKIIYCSIFTAGINSADHIEYTKDFLSAISALKKTIEAGRKTGCTIGKYKKKPCLRVRDAWTRFFNSFGTHYVTKIILGGKIVYKEERSKNLDASEKTRDLNLSLTGSAVVSANGAKKLGNERATTNSTSMYGGLSYDNNKEWFRGLKANPVPIKLVLKSFKEVLGEHGINAEYIQILKIH